MKTIPIDSELTRFKEHLERNKRIVFSAKFGDGKTYFLKSVRDKLKDEYHFITLYPVNYSVAENEDIFEYIKRDILLQLAQDNYLDDIDFEKAVESVFDYESMREVISFILSFIPGGPAYDKIITKLEGFKKKYDNKKKTFEKFNGIFKSQKGGLYEHDGYTNLIENAIRLIQGEVLASSKNKKCALIIEDLDRIDPGHLFRILNVLGAHIDHEVDRNKFGFDNIIIVMDYEVAEKIFHHFYGNNANYWGYMSKFVSQYPFNYSITEIGRTYLKNFFKEKCNLVEEDFTKIKYEFGEQHTLLDLINTKTIRDVLKTIDNIDSQIRFSEYKLADNLKTDSKSPLCYFLALLYRLLPDFNQSIVYTSLLETNDIMKIIGNSLIAVNPKILSGIPFIFYNTIKKLNYSHDKDHSLNQITFDTILGNSSLKVKIPSMGDLTPKYRDAFVLAANSIIDLKVDFGIFYNAENSSLNVPLEPEINVQPVEGTNVQPIEGTNMLFVTE